MPAFKSVTLKVATGRAIRINWERGGRFNASSLPLLNLLESSLKTPVFLMEGLPGWVVNARYDISADAGFDPTLEESWAMARAMFQDRFGLRYRVEQRELDVFLLRVADPGGRLGVGLRRSTADCSTALATPIVDTPILAAGARRLCAIAGGVGTIAADALLVSDLTTHLTRELQRYVVDRTGLAGRFDVDLSYATPVKKDAAPIPEALQQQLGLKLEAGRALVPVVVIERLEAPVE